MKKGQQGVGCNGGPARREPRIRASTQAVAVELPHQQIPNYRRHGAQLIARYANAAAVGLKH